MTIEIVESAEQALGNHLSGHRIKAWARVAKRGCGCQSCMEWEVTLASGQEIRLHGHGELVAFCHGVASAAVSVGAHLAGGRGRVVVADLLMGRTQEQMRDAFARVKNRENWKLPVDMLIPYGDPWVDDESRAMIDDAVLFYTGAPTDWQQSNVGWHVRAAGYYACIGG